jgi:hypothetical protein
MRACGRPVPGNDSVVVPVDPHEDDPWPAIVSVQASRAAVNSCVFISLMSYVTGLKRDTRRTPREGLRVAPPVARHSQVPHDE